MIWNWFLEIILKQKTERESENQRDNNERIIKENIERERERNWKYDKCDDDTIQ